MTVGLARTPGSLERAVRPFQQSLIAPRNLTLEQLQELDPDRVILGSAGGTTFDWSYSFSGSARSDVDSFKETKRTSETVRVTNPDDDNQFIDIKRPLKVNLSNVHNPKLKRSYQFTYPATG